MRVLIVDDEAPARARLREMLAAHADMEIVGEADTGVRAMQLTAELRPDLLLLDIQMPGCTGIDVVASLPEPRPRVIFCTAYDQHAVDAFELHAIDYLLKPISRARLAKALDRARESRSQPALNAVRPAGPARFLVKNAAHYLVIGEAKTPTRSAVTWFDGAFRNAIDFDPGPPPMLVNRNRGSGTRILIDELLGSLEAGAWEHDKAIAAVAQGPFQQCVHRDLAARGMRDVVEARGDLLGAACEFAARESFQY
jgi:two-component system LytT family response regulator